MGTVVVAPTGPPDMILSTPHPSDHMLVRNPIAPAATNRGARAGPDPFPNATPIRFSHSAVTESRAARAAAADRGDAHCAQFVSGRQLGCGSDNITNFPFAVTSHRAKLALSATSETGGSITTSPSAPPGGVLGLHGSSIASSVRRRGTMSWTSLGPRVQSRHVPYCSLCAGTPHAVYVRTSQSFAARFAGDPVSRGPMESISTCASDAAC